MGSRSILAGLGALSALIFGLARLTPGLAEEASHPGAVTLDPSAYSSVYALSDVHGMYAATRTLLTENGLLDTDGNWSGGKALVLVVGDSIDKGSQSIDVIDLWIRIMPQARAAGGLVVHLLGNHEADFLADPTPSDDKAQALFAELQARGIPLAELTDPQFPRARFLRSLPVAARVGSWLFCHAGYYPDLSWADFAVQTSRLLTAGSYGDPFFSGEESILDSKKWWELGSASRAALEARLDRASLAGVVFGHQPNALFVSGEAAVSEDGRLIKIDNGMAPTAGAHPGSLLLFPNPTELSSARRPMSYALIHGQRVPLAPESRVEPQD